MEIKLTGRVCACPGCEQSLDGKRSDAQYCTPKCAKRAPRIVELGLDAWPEPTPLKPVVTATHCRNGHAWTADSHRIAKDGRRVCLLCRRARIPKATCKQGHEFTEENTRIATSGQRVCRTCMQSWRKKWKVENPEKRREEQRRRYAADPERARRSARQWREENLEHALEKARRWRAENPDRVKENYRRWVKENPESKRLRDNNRRARKVQAAICGPLSPSVYAGVIGSGPCVYCGKKATEVDHVRPLSRGGIEHGANLVPACKSCNSAKKDRLLNEWDEVKIARAVTKSRIVRKEWKRLQRGQDVLF